MVLQLQPPWKEKATERSSQSSLLKIPPYQPFRHNTHNFGKGPAGALGGPGDGAGGPLAPPIAGDSGRAEPGRLLVGVEPDTPPKSMPARFALVCLTFAPPSSSLLSESLSLLAASPQSSSVLVRLGRIGVGLTTGGGGEAIAPVGGRKKGLLAPLGAPAAAPLAGEATGLTAAATPAWLPPSRWKGLLLPLAG